jgi:hypothetical protein
MAGPGTYSAYNELKPLQGDLSADIRTQEDADFKYRQERRVDDAIEQQRKDKELARKEKIFKESFENLPRNYDTGSASLNSVQAGIIQKGVNRIGEIAGKLQKDNLSDEERIKLMIERNNLEKLPDNLKVATERFSGMIKEYKQGVENGTIFKNDAFESKVLSGFDGYLGAIDDTGLPVLAFRDTNGDGKVDANDIQTYDNLSQGIGTWDFQKQFDLDKMAGETAKTLGKTDITTDQGYRSVQTQTPKLDALNLVADKLFVNPDGTPTATALSEMRKRKLPVDKSSIETVKQYYKDAVIAQSDFLRKEDFDYAARSKDNEEARLRRGAEVKDKPGPGEPVVPSFGTWEKQFATIDPAKNLSVPVTGKVPLANLRTNDGRNIPNAMVENYTYDKQGKLVIDVSYDLPKTSTKTEGLEGSETTTVAEKRKEQIKVTPETEGRIAKILGLKKRDMRNLSYIGGWDPNAATKPAEAPKKTTSNIGSKYN